jgi:hypothetical protein
MTTQNAVDAAWVRRHGDILSIPKGDAEWGGGWAARGYSPKSVGWENGLNFDCGLRAGQVNVF